MLCRRTFLVVNSVFVSPRAEGIRHGATCRTTISLRGTFNFFAAYLGEICRRKNKMCGSVFAAQVKKEWGLFRRRRIWFEAFSMLTSS